MAKQDNPKGILVILGIVLVLIFILPKMGLFSTTSNCINEPTNIQDYVNVLSQIGINGCYYYNDTGQENVKCCTNNTNELNCLATTQLQVTRYLIPIYTNTGNQNGVTIMNQTGYETCQDYINDINKNYPSFYLNTSISGKQVFYSNLTTPGIWSFCSNDNKINIDSKSLTLAQNYVNGICQTTPKPITTNWWEQTIFPIGTFNVTVWMLLLIFGLILLIIIASG